MHGSMNIKAVDTVVCTPDDGWRYHPKHVDQFPDKINCVTLHIVGYILKYPICCDISRTVGDPLTIVTETPIQLTSPRFILLVPKPPKKNTVLNAS